MGNNNAPNQGMGGGMSQNQMQGPGPMRNNRQQQQNRGTPYKQNIQNNGTGNRGNFQRRNSDNGQMGAGNNQMPINRFDNMPMDRQSSGQGFGGSQSSMNSSNMMNNRNYNDDNSFGFGEDRRGFALPSFPNGQNNFGNNDRQNNSGMGGNRRNGKFMNAWKYS